jgi:N-acetylglucosaminyl-diphospho-decaprenol L-rhamnosyltransferase
MKLLVIVVNYRTAALTVKAVEAVLPQLARWPGSSVVVVENDSKDGSFESLAAASAAHGWSEQVKLIASPNNGGFGAGVNIGLRHGLALAEPPEYFYLLNPDAMTDPGAVSALVDFLDGQAQAGIAGSHLYTPDGTPHSSSFRFPSILGELDAGLRLGAVSRLLGRWVVAIPPSHDTRQVDWVAGASLMVRREVVRDIGLFDEGFFLYFEETDFCIRARRRGWTAWYVGNSTVAHIGGVATGMDHTGKVAAANRGTRPPMPSYWFESRRRYYDKNHGAVYRVATDAVFLASHALWRLRCELQRRPHNDPPRLLRDLLRHGVSRSSASDPGRPVTS